MASNESNLGDVFKAVIDGQKILQTNRGSASYDELVLAIPAYNKVTDADGNISYQISNPTALPIEAFFYTNATGLTEAQGYQKDYLEATQTYIPVVKFDFDTTTGKVTYSYNKADQSDSYNQSNS